MIETSSLRKKLLDLAIRGHLTASWRNEWEWEGELPAGWKMVKFGELYSIVGAREHQIKTSEILEEGLYPVVSQGQCMIDGYSSDSTKVIFVDSKPIILFGDHTKNVKYIDFDFVVGADGTKLFRPLDGVDAKWLYYCTLNASVGLGDRGYGRHWGLLNKAQIPLPPLEEQKAIVKRLEELLALEKEIAADSAALDELASAARRKILDLAIRGRLTASWREELEWEGELPSGWKMVKLGEVCDYGKTVSVDPKNLKPDSWVLDLEDIERDTGRLLARVSAKDRKSSSTKHSFVKGTLLYSKLRTYLNKVLIAPEDGCCTSEILPLVFNESVIPEYARIVLMSPMFLEYTAMCCYGVKMPRLGTSDGRKAPFPLPPLEEQKAIVAKIEELLAAIKNLKG